MEEDRSAAKSPGGLPPSSSRSGGGFSGKAEGLPSSSSAAAGPGGEPDSGRFSHDVSRMPDFPPKNIGHRRAHSEILSLPDDINFDGDLGVVGPFDAPSLSDDTEEDFFSMYIDMEKFGSSAEASGPVALQVGESSGAAAATASCASKEDSMAIGGNDRPKIRHQHSQSMDGSTSIETELLGSGGGDGLSSADAKKAISAAKLADLALVDPKRAKRILANRQSAARSKERKMRYIAELERKLQTLQTEATTLSAQLGMLQRDNNGLTAENNELKLRLQTMEQQVHLQDALNDTLREEVQRLKMLTGQAMPNGASMMNAGPSFGANPQFYAPNHAMQSLLAAQQLQQLQIHSQRQQQLYPSHHHHHQQQHHHPPQQSNTDIKIKVPMASQSLQNQSQRENALSSDNPSKE